MHAVRELWSQRVLVGNLARRELKGKYKRSVLGWLWSLINPAATLATYTLVFGFFLKFPPPVAGNGTLENFALYLFAALTVWNFFNAIVVGSMGALLSAGPLLSKVRFPAEAPVFANALAALSQTIIEFGILALVMVVVGNSGWTLLLLPVVIVWTLLLSLGLGLVLALANVYWRDVSYLVSVVLQILFYGTPIIYTLEQIGDSKLWGISAADILLASPLTLLTETSRDLSYLLVVPDVERMLYVTAWSIVTFVVGWAVFRRFAGDVVESL